jgi:hypothetical protein
MVDDSATCAERRLRRATSSWPAATARVARAYLRGLHRTGRRAGTDGDPFWLLLPVWLHATATPRARRALRSRFLADVCWGQYCLFLCIRIHDDLFDGHASDLRLIFVADHLLVESQRAFAPHVPDAFWPIYHDLLQTTTSAILEMDERQRAGAGTRDGLAAHARVASIFKAGAAAVCLATGQRLSYARVGAFADELAIMAQVLDDLEDFVEDGERGRLNSVAALLTQSGGRCRAPRDVRAAGTSLLFGDGARRLLMSLRESYRRAREAIRPLRIDPADCYLQVLEQNLDELAAMLHRARVEARFGTAATAARGAERIE